MVVSKEDIKAVNRNSIALADGSGYLATLEVFHQLHCLWVHSLLSLNDMILMFFCSETISVNIFQRTTIKLRRQNSGGSNIWVS